MRLSWLSSASVEESNDPLPSIIVPSLEVNITCMCRKEMGAVVGSSRSSRKTSWKCVAARTFGHSGPRSRRSLRTPQNKPAPSEAVKKLCIDIPETQKIFWRSLERGKRSGAKISSVKITQRIKGIPGREATSLLRVSPCRIHPEGSANEQCSYVGPERLD